MKTIFSATVIFLVGLAHGQVGAFEKEYYAKRCWSVKTDLRNRIQKAGDDAARKKLGLPPLIWITVQTQGFDFSKLDELAEMIHRVRPDLGDTKKIKRSLIESVREDWVRVAKEQGIRSLRGEIESIFTGQRLSMIVDSAVSSSPGSISWEFEVVTKMSATLPTKVQYTVKLVEQELSVTMRSGQNVSHGMSNFDKVIEILFDREKLIWNLKDMDQAVPDFAKNALEYFERRNIASSLSLESDDMLRILARGNEEVFNALKRAEAESMERFGRSLTTWEFMVRHWRYGVALVVVGGLVASYWDDLFPSKERKHVRASMIKVPKGLQDDDRAWIEDYLVNLVEDFDLEDLDSINQTINGMSCDAAYALWVYVTTYKPF